VTLRFDLAMSALCLNALRGCSTAALVLAHVLNCLGSEDPSFRPLGASWFARNRAAEASPNRAVSKKVPYSPMRLRVRQTTSTDPVAMPPPPIRQRSAIPDAPISTNSVGAARGSGSKTRLR
jgi:hypothetical protein